MPNRTKYAAEAHIRESNHRNMAPAEIPKTPTPIETLVTLVIEGNLILKKPYVNQKRTESGIQPNRTELAVGGWGPVMSFLVSAERRSS
jgi:hypothetical protein